MLNSKALGIIETADLPGALTAAGAAAKIENIEIISREDTGKYITLFVKGEMGAVKEALQNSTSAVKKQGGYAISHLLRLPHSDINIIIPGKGKIE